MTKQAAATLVGCVAQVVQNRPHLARFLCDIEQTRRSGADADRIIYYVLTEYEAGRCRLTGELAQISRCREAHEVLAAVREYLVGRGLVDKLSA